MAIAFCLKIRGMLGSIKSENQVTDGGKSKSKNNLMKKNTGIYRKVFGCYPDDNIKKL